MRPNTVKRLLQEGKPAIGTWLGLGSPLAAEWLGHVGFDWLNIEQEHGAVDATLTLSLLQAISINDAIPLVRIPWKSPDHAKRALDAGAYGLFVPTINTREEAELMVKAMKYPPAGFRGLGGSRRTLYGGSDYVKYANDEIMVILMIESAEGVRNAEEILSVPGVDACFVGPNDLAISLGLAPSLDPDFPEYEEAIAKIMRACKNNGVAPGMHTPNAQRCADRIEQGWLLNAINSDGGFMAAGAAAAVKGVRERVGGAAGAAGESAGRPQY
jgi:4-hydroxy-2-oxoheptanedioate aldolase